MLKILILAFALLWTNLTWATTAAQQPEQQYVAKVLQQTKKIDPKVLQLAVQAYTKAKTDGLIKNTSTLTIIDYSKPAAEERFWVINMQNGEVLHQIHVSHGKNSGVDTSGSFSNQARSRKSSIGVFLSEGTYIGRNGYSLRLVGLEPGYNDNARRRGIVIHGASYATGSYAKAYGRLGRSWGCPAIGSDVSKQVINTIKNGSLVFSFYPDKKWLANSSFLT